MYESGSYFPSAGEIFISIGLVSAGALVYAFLVENLNILGRKHAVQINVHKNKDIRSLIWAFVRPNN